MGNGGLQLSGSLFVMWPYFYECMLAEVHCNKKKSNLNCSPVFSRTNLKIFGSRRTTQVNFFFLSSDCTLKLQCSLLFVLSSKSIKNSPLCRMTTIKGRERGKLSPHLWKCKRPFEELKNSFPVPPHFLTVFLSTVIYSIADIV